MLSMYIFHYFIKYPFEVKAFSAKIDEQKAHFSSKSFFTGRNCSCCEFVFLPILITLRSHQ